MAKPKVTFVCNACGAVSSKWMGRCLECGAWNTFVETVERSEAREKTLSIGGSDQGAVQRPQSIGAIKTEETPRYTTRIGELDIVLGGGLVKGSLILVGGDPGIGKSTLLLQMASHLAEQGRKVLYVSGEESMRQTKLRAERLGVQADALYVAAENNIQHIQQYVAQIAPEVLIVDSIQTVYMPEIASAPGSVSQVREATNQFMSIAKRDGITTFLVGHVTKSGSIAGPKILEHMVDTVLYFEGEGHKLFRILRAVKNRFGSTNEIGVFEMTETGLDPVDNPSKMFLASSSKNEAGSIIIPSLEGTRTVLVEMQCLVSRSNFNMPRRMAIGIDYNKLILLTAVLEKRAGIALYEQDVYLNVVGGVNIDEPAADLAVVMAIASSYKNVVVPEDMVIFGEVGLTGEIRAVGQAQQRINEAARMGFTKAIIPAGNLEGLSRPSEGFKIIGLKHIEEMLNYFL